MPPNNVILMWSGFSNLVPPGYQLCNGTGGSPDLRDRFIQGYGAEAIGVTGGANSHAVSHNHTLPGTMQADSASHSHGIAGATDGFVSPGFALSGVNNQAGSPSGHFHPLVGAGPWNTAADAHLHTMSGVTSTKSLTLDNRPQYYVLAFIQKISASCFTEFQADVIQGSDDADDTGISAGFLTMDAGHGSTMGLRFQNVTVPPGANILLAYVAPDFFSDNFPATGVMETWGEAADNPATFTAGTLPNTRTKTAASTLTAWAMGSVILEHWLACDTTAIIQELVNRPGWASGNAMVFLLESDDAESGGVYAFESGAAFAARLIIEYT